MSSALDIHMEWGSRRYRKGDPRTPIPPCVITLSAMELQLEVFRFLPTKYIVTNANKMRPQSSRTMWRLMRVYLQAQTAVHTHLITVILITGKT